MGDKIGDKGGNYVFVNGHTVGLSNKLVTSRSSPSRWAPTSPPSPRSPLSSPARCQRRSRRLSLPSLQSGRATKRVYQEMHLLEKTDAVDRWINDAALEFV